MNHTLSDFVVHVDETLPETEMNAIAEDIGHNRCFTQACVSMRAPHLMVVKYDSECISALEIVNQINHHGVHAEAVGM